MNKKKPLSRRSFLKTAGTTAAALPVALSASSYANIVGANKSMNVAVIGITSRGNALLKAATETKNVNVSHICDVDSNALAKGVASAKKIGNKKVQGEADFRRILDNNDVDGVLIATPDHWHAPMALMALKAGKHVYVEKPCSHSPHEGEMLIEAQKKYGKVVQMGNQQRSGPGTIEAIKMIHEGGIGKAYFGKAWYANSRGSIGKGKEAAVPDWLDYELWQGPAPRMPYMDNLVHYNWHWFWNWGTGEISNNGTHEMDICRWALQADFPIRVSSAGGRYHFDDDWQFYDTQLASFDFEGGKTLTWEGHSCNGVSHYNRGRGALVRGTEGSVLMDRNGYIVYDVKGKVVKERKEDGKSATTNTVGAGFLDSVHMDNFFAAIRDGAAQNSPIDEGHKSVLMCQLGNISQELGRSLNIDPTDGHIMGDAPAMAMWRRSYEPGWEMMV
ncbi:MAG: Gfo/Idh/MocA family oxidoreductase [Bacteroidota bacterium]